MSPSAISRVVDTPDATPPEHIGDISNPDLISNGVKRKLAALAATQAELDASRLIFTRTTKPREPLNFSDPLVNNGSICTDHMITAVWHEETGWGAPELKPYGPFSIMPTASVLHYATECFEGMKVYRGFDGRLRLFRPDCNMARLIKSASRIALPAFDPDELEKLIKILMAVDGPKFLPKSVHGRMLYLRPTMIGTEASLGVKVPREATLYVIASYFPEYSEMMPNGMKLLASSNDEVRAWPGGFGFAKVGANYGPSLYATGEAKKRGYDQVLWLFGQDGTVTEAGASNFFVVWRSREGKLQLVTAPLGDKVILDGVTRRSVIQLAKERLADDKILEAVEIVQRKYTMDEIVEAVQEGRLVEAFACGTAYFVTPVAEIHFRGKDLEMPMALGKSGEYAAALKSWLKDIMYGRVQHEWGVEIDEEHWEKYKTNLD